MKTRTVTAVVAAGLVCATRGDEWTTVNEFLQGLSLKRNETELVDGNEDWIKDALVPGNGDTVGSLVNTGNFALKNVSCDDFVLLGELDITPLSNDTHVFADVEFMDFTVTCRGSLVWSSLDVQPFGTFSGGVIPDGESTFVFTPPGSGALGGPANFSSSFVWEMESSSNETEILRPIGISVDLNRCEIMVVSVEWVNGLPPDARPLFQTIVRELLSRSVVCDSMAKLAARGSQIITALNYELDNLTISESTAEDSEVSMLAALSEDQRESITKLNENVGAQITLQFLNQVLAANSDVANPAYPDLAINGVMEKLTESEVGAVDVKLVDDVSYLDGTTQFSRNAKFVGLTQFSKVNLLQLIDGLEYSVSNQFSLRTASFTSRPTVTLVKAGTSLLGGAVTFENGFDFSFDLEFNLTNVSATFTNALAMNLDEVSEQQVGQVQEEPFSCAGQSIYKVNVSTFELRTQSTPVRLSVFNFTDGGLNKASHQLGTLATLLYQDSVTGSLPKITYAFAPMLTTLFNGAFEQAAKETCPEYTPDYPANTLVDFTSESFTSIRETVDSTVVNVDDPNVGINKVIRELVKKSESDDGSLLIPGPFDGLVPLNEVSNLSVSISNIKMYNLDAFKSLTLLEPVNPDPTRTLRTALRVAQPSSSPIVFTADLRLNGTGDADVNESTIARIEFTAVDVRLDVTLNLLQLRLNQLSLNQLASVPCLLSALDYEGEDSGLLFQSASVNLTGLTVDCSTCQLSSNDRKGLTENVEKIIGLLPTLVETAKSDSARRTVNDALLDLSRECTGATSTPSPSLDLYTSAGLNSVLITNGVVYFVLGVSMIGCCLFGKVRNNNSQNRVDLETPRTQDSPTWDGGYSSPQPQTLSLLSEDLSFTIKALVLLLLLGSFVLFISANLSVGADVQAIISVGKDISFKVDNIFSLTLTGTINDMFNGGIPAIGVLIALMSGCWPYVRLAGLFACLCLPPSLLSAKARGNVLSTLDFFGKWAVVDQFLIMILIAVFDVRILFPSNADSFLPENFLGINVGLVPSWGVYGFFLGAITSILANHLLSYMHRSIVSPSSVKYGRTTREVALALRHKEKLYNHIFSRQVGNTTVQIRLSSLTFLFHASTIVCTILLITSMFIPVVDFYYKGAGGTALGLMKDNGDSVTLSMSDVVLKLQAQGDSPIEALGIAFLQVFFVLTVLVAPILQQVGLLLELTIPLALREQRFICFGLEIVAAWASFDVFVVSIAFAAMFIENFVAFAVSRPCSSINPVIQTWAVGFGLLTESEATCFSTTGSLPPTFVLVVATALLSLINNYTLNSVARLAIEEREERVRFVKGLQNPASFGETSLGCFNSSIKRNLSLLNQMGFIQTRKVVLKNSMVSYSQASSYAETPESYDYTKQAKTMM